MGLRYLNTTQLLKVVAVCQQTTTVPTSAWQDRKRNGKRMYGNVLVYYKALSQHSSGENKENKIKTCSAPAVSGRNSNPTPHPPPTEDRIRSVKRHTVECQRQIGWGAVESYHSLYNGITSEFIRRECGMRKRILSGQ